MDRVLLAPWRRFAAGEALAKRPSATLLSAVVLTAILGGVAPGTLGAVLSGLATWSLFAAPHDALGPAWPNGQIAAGVYGALTALDLYLIHAAFRALDRLQAERARADGLVERQRTMVAELQHRVANTMQFASSLLAIEKRRVAADPACAPAALDEAVERLRTMARVHRRLHDPAAATMGFGQHLQDLCADLLDGAGAQHIACRVDAMPVDLPAETLITLSLIAAEAVTNSLKHAWPTGEGGNIRIAIERLGPGRVALEVSDNGRGPPAGHDPAKGGSLGLRIMRSLVQQLGGELSVAAEGGTTTRVVFAA